MLILGLEINPEIPKFTNFGTNRRSQSACAIYPGPGCGVAKMPDKYAAMSHYEFFAETYALYYDYDDPKRRVIPAAIAECFDDNIGKRDLKKSRRPATRRKLG